MTDTLTTEDYANELLNEGRQNGAPYPHRWAFVEALDARGTDARTKRFKHYDRIIKWMIANWAELDIKL